MLLSACNSVALAIWQSHSVDILKAFCGNNHNRVHSSSCHVYCSSYSNSIALITFRDMLHSALHTAYLLVSRSNSITIPYLYTNFQTAMFRRSATHHQSSPVGRCQWEMECILPCASCSKCRGEIETKGESPTTLSLSWGQLMISATGG
jgi:hypothetical protein